MIGSFPDPRQEVLDRWKESGDKLPDAKLVVRFNWMVKQYGYKSEEVQSPYLRPAGWVYEVVNAQKQKENYQKKKDKASKKD